MGGGGPTCRARLWSAGTRQTSRLQVAAWVGLGPPLPTKRRSRVVAGIQWVRLSDTMHTPITGVAKRATPPPGLRPAAVALRAAQNHGLPRGLDRHAQVLRLFRWSSRPMVSCRDEVSALTTTVAAQSVPRDANALWPGSDEDLRWRPGASYLPLCFAPSPTNSRKFRSSSG